MANLTYRYDALNRLTNRVDAVGTTGYTFVQGRLRSEDGPWASDTVSWSYNSAGERSQMVILQPTGNAWTNTYGWDALHRLTQVSSPSGSFSSLFSGAGDRIRNLTQPGGFWVTNAYDSLARLTDTSLRDAGNGLLNRHGYVLNAADQRTKVSRTNSAATVWNGYGIYTYDAAGEVRTARAYDGSGAAVASENFDYGYDAGWNLLKRTNNTAVTPYAINVLNQISNDGGSSWVHDANGNLTFRPNAGSSDLSYAYDAENQLQSVSATNAWKIEFTYDGQGRLRVRKDYTWSTLGGTWTLGLETRHRYDGMLLVQERSSANNPLVTYTRGTDLSGSLDGAGGIGGLLSRGAHATTSPYAVATSAYYHADGNGNVTLLVGSGSPSVKAYYKYAPFGQTLASGGSLASDNVMRFSSKPVMGSSGLYYYGYRFYDPTSQRWPNRDPIGEAGGANLYGFVCNNPINLWDPTGRTAAGAAIGGAIGAGVGAWTGGIIGGAGGAAGGTLVAPGVGTIAGVGFGATEGAVAGGIVGGGFGAWAGNLISNIYNSVRNPWTGAPGTEETCHRPDGKKKQTRRYGPDGYPEKDTDFDHDHGQGQPHVHEWDRPSDGRPPTDGNRGPGQPPKPGDPGIPIPPAP